MRNAERSPSIEAPSAIKPSRVARTSRPWLRPVISMGCGEAAATMSARCEMDLSPGRSIVPRRGPGLNARAGASSSGIGVAVSYRAVENPVDMN